MGGGAKIMQRIWRHCETMSTFSVKTVMPPSIVCRSSKMMQAMGRCSNHYDQNFFCTGFACSFSVFACRGESRQMELQSEFITSMSSEVLSPPFNDVWRVVHTALVVFQFFLCS